MDEYQFSGSNGGETFEEGAETMETEEGAGVTGPDETQEILRSNSLKLKSFLFALFPSGRASSSSGAQTSLWNLKFSLSSKNTSKLVEIPSRSFFCILEV